jgi:hypothetical protein
VEPGGGHEAWQREEGTNGCGVVHAETLHQNLHQFQAEENAMNAAIDKAFSRIESQNDPLEAGKILKRFCGIFDCGLQGGEEIAKGNTR